jgi:phage baseplate assembly protein W
MNYKLPIDFSRLFESDIRNLSKQNEKDSIDQNLELIITTCPGEHKYDPKFGCQVWNLDFERVVSKSLWEGKFLQFISESIKKYEPRIYDVETHITFFDTKKEDMITGATFIKKRVEINIDARLISNGAKCRFYYSLYLGPLNSD